MNESVDEECNKKGTQSPFKRAAGNNKKNAQVENPEASMQTTSGPTLATWYAMASSVTLADSRDIA